MAKKKSRRTRHRGLLLCVIFLLSTLLMGMVGWIWYSENVDRSGWHMENGNMYYRNFYGQGVSGWQEIQGKQYYFTEDSAVTFGWLELDGSRYYFDNEGILTTGWADIDRNRYYFHEDGGLATGWLEEDGKSYYLGETGAMATGWTEVEGTQRYFDKEGVLTTGWVETKDGPVYASPEGGIRTGWLDTEEGRYYLDEKGHRLSGIVTIDGADYRFREDGRLLTGWAEIDGVRCCFSESGQLLTGWQTIDEKLYYLNQDGSVHGSGWLEIGEYRYYIRKDGTAAVGPTEIDGRTYYFTPKGIEIILVNPWHEIPEDYEVDHVDVERGVTVDRRCYDALMEMLEDCREAGCYPAIAGAYRSLEKQQAIYNMYYNRYRNQGYSKEDARAKTDARVAAPGTSEHHLGLALDISGVEYYGEGHPGSSDEVQAWLEAHCWDYGFILRYTEDKTEITGITSEPWHFRYVGTEVSLDMKDSGLCLEEYLGAVTHESTEETQ